jgi:cell division transport system ATP-binding protein
MSAAQVGLTSRQAHALELDGVSKRFPGTERPVLADATLRIATGEWVFLVGRSGAGKSTVLRMLYGAVAPDRGHARVLGTDLASTPHFRVRQRLGLVFQSFDLLPQKTAFENVAYGAEILGLSPRWAKARAAAMLEAVGLTYAAARFPRQLSGGEQQRVGLARALIHRPPVVLADEPTGNLDIDAARAIHGIFERIHDEWSPTIVIATHSLELIRWANRRVVRVQDGTLFDEAESSPSGQPSPGVARPPSHP